MLNKEVVIKKAKMELRLTNWEQSFDIVLTSEPDATKKELIIMFMNLIKVLEDSDD